MDSGSTSRIHLEERPYRSHLQPACLPCRKRKSRCKTISSSTKCLTCESHGTSCVFPPTEDKERPKNRLNHRTRAARRIRNTSSGQGNYLEHNAIRSPSNISTGSSSQIYAATQARYSNRNRSAIINDAQREDHSSHLVTLLGESGNDNSHVVSPAIVDDSEVLHSYLATSPGGRNRMSKQTDHQSPSVSSRRGRVLFNSFPRRPLGVSADQSPAFHKCELIEKFLDHDLEEVVNMFFTHANICFPIFDATSFKRTFTNHRRKISPALLSNLYANSLVYWSKSSSITGRCPDVRFIWVQANEALMAEIFLSPGLSTVITIVLNICGRPSTSIFGNGGMLGIAISLSHALGLHRDPSNWDIPPSEKSFRTRVWWLIVVLDRWCSLAYGTPLHIHRAQHDVPLPTLQDIYPHGGTSIQLAAASIFVSWVSLTEVLGRLLEHIYHVSKAATLKSTVNENLQLEIILTEWEESLPEDIRKIVMRGTDLSIPGAANFRLAYLAVKLLLRRIQLDMDMSERHYESEDMSQYNIYSQRAAEEIVLLIKELDESHLSGFWIPVNAFAITSATTLLLRSSLRSKDPAHSPPLRIAKDMIACLRRLQQDSGWDLADNCIASCGDVVEKIEAHGNAPTTEPTTYLQDMLDNDSFALDDFLLDPVYAFDDGCWDLS
ncbi:hypothetical protein BU24DRAFT_451511 [Aaosphaeria arxii CBS 175.79]|uniref:Zn(2)-C6 fungal-type domain-containing protein n=1 Tax=Aaosphaeria arxii CBS 175.79 TaxID=1450172 RepID=A0A6A5XMY4_9PLEO|nr:uncharacterized protein BU24DRAFT_451511 [Aaosphaeria arxii CBS 175.79]KAF2014482.1 hypothetical protein BU24DRAFT_451511 [Aaosphaeria arxii CBS 175.79]